MVASNLVTTCASERDYHTVAQNPELSRMYDVLRCMNTPCHGRFKYIPSYRSNRIASSNKMAKPMVKNEAAEKLENNDIERRKRQHDEAPSSYSAWGQEDRDFD